MEAVSKQSLSQKDYLKKYLSKKEKPKKKKKVKLSSSSHLKRSQIIDEDDLNLNAIASIDDEDFNLEYLGDEAPAIAGIIDERPDHLKEPGQWKSLAEKTENPFGAGIDDLWGTKDQNEEPESMVRRVSDAIKARKVTNQTRKKDREQETNYESDPSPPRMEKRNRISLSPKRRDSDSDVSPPRSNTDKKKYSEVTRKGENGDVSMKNPKYSTLEIKKNKYRSVTSHDSENSDSDQSLPSRKSRKNHSPPRSRPKNYDNDMSPHRKNKVDLSTTVRKRRNSDSDISPPRKYNKDRSPPRKQRSDSNSPPRKSKNNKDYSSLRRQRKYSDSDISPPRNHSKSPLRKNKNNADISPPRRQREESDSDVSPPRKHKDLSPPRKPRNQSKSPARKSKNKAGISPSRRTRKYSDKDMSPPQKPRKDYSPPRKEYSESPPRKHNRDDFSPIRGQQRESSKNQLSRLNRRDLGNQSPPKKNSYKDRSPRRNFDEDNNRSEYSQRSQKPDSRRHSPLNHKYNDNFSRTSTNESDRNPNKGSKNFRSQISPRRQLKDSERDLSPPRKSRKNDNDLSPPRKNYKENERSCTNYDSDLSPPRKSGKSGRNFPIQDQGKKRANESRFAEKSKETSGHDSDLSPPRVRPKHSTNEEKRLEKTLDGKKAGLQDARALRDELSTLRQKEEHMFREMGHSSGNQGSVVMRDRKTGKIRDVEKEKAETKKKEQKNAQLQAKYAKWSKGIAQAEAAEARVKDTLHEMSKPLARSKDDSDLDKFLRDQEREGDPMLDYIRSKQKSAHSVEKGKKVYQGSYPPNRFNIRPGHRWDGVDRSSGYERKWFEQINARKALQEEAYKWSSEDL